MSLTQTIVYLGLSSLLIAAATFLALRYGWARFILWLYRQEQRLHYILVYQLLMDVSPRMVIVATAAGMVLLGLVGWVALKSFLGFLAGAAFGYAIPYMVVVYQENKRRSRLESQLVDGVVALASGVRAGLNLVQAMELLVKNSAGPIKQEFGQLLREYQMGLDLNQCMRNAADRIALANYRLLFTAIEMHRRRGGDTGESLDRIAESIREIQRLEGKLDAVTAQGRSQARMMAISAMAIIGIYWMIDPEGVAIMFSDQTGRLLMMVALALIVAGFLWIRKIMAVDI